MRMTRSPLFITAALGLAVAGGSAVTASNTVPTTSAGQGEEVVSGYTVSDVEYTMGAVADGTGDDVTGARFRLTADVPANGEAPFARARVTGGGTASARTYATCVEDSTASDALGIAHANIWDCTFPGTAINAEDVTGLDVVAWQ